jgi:hypothetical protein
MDVIFCNAENRPFDASQFSDGPGNIIIHNTENPHTLDGWPAMQGPDGTWVLIQNPAAVPSLPDVAGDEPPSGG